MTVETATHISDLNASYPAATDGKVEGDDHIRLLKSTIKATFPNVAGAVTPTHTELNYVDGVTSAIQTQIDAKAATAALAATTGAALVGAIQTGTGATARTVQTKLRDTCSVKDFGAVADGVTDDTAAFTAAFLAHDVVYVPAGTYAVTSFTMNGRGKVLRGAGRGKTLIQTASLTSNIIVQDSSETQVYAQEISGITIVCGDGTASFGTRTAGAHIKSLKYPRNCIYSDLELMNVYDGFSFNGAQYCYFEDIWINQYGADAGSGRSAFRFANALDGVDASYCTDVHISNLQVAGYSKLTYGIYVNRMDGLYINNSHLMDVNYVIYCDAAPDTGSPVYMGRMASLQVSNSYLDACSNSHVLFTGALTGSHGPAMFSNCEFRASAGNLGSVGINSAIGNITFTGCTFNQNAYSAIITGTGGAAGLASGLSVSGCQFYNNNTSNTANHGDVIWRGTGGSITGTVHALGGANGYSILLGSDGTGADTSNINTTASTATVGATVTGGFVSQVTGCWVDGEQRGSNANGSYMRTKLGHLECWHRIVTSSSADTTWTYPYAFLTGSIPIISVTTGNTAGPNATIANLPATQTATAATLNAFNTSNARQVVVADVRAIGSWK